MAQKILHLDDEIRVLNSTSGRLRSNCNVEVFRAETIAEALEILESEKIVLGVIDLQLAGDRDGNSNDFVRRYFPEGNYVRYTSAAPDEVPEDCRGFGVIHKAEPEKLVELVNSSLARIRSIDQKP